jgi:Na+/melibiose symporter-like transporter
MVDVGAQQRGVVSGLLNLSRNLGLITGASLMGAVFAMASGTGDVATAPPQAVAAGMSFTFAIAVGMIAVALAIAAIHQVVPAVRNLLTRSSREP